MKRKPILYHVVDLMNYITDYLYNIYVIRSNNISYGKKNKINGKIWVKPNLKGTIVIGDNVIINSGYRNNPIGAFDKVTFWTQGEGRIVIGNGVGMSNTAIVAAKEVTIEDDVFIGGGTRIYDTDFHSVCLEERIKYENDGDIKSEKVIIRKGAFIGSGVIVLKGVTIGERSVVGAGAVVTKDIPAGEIWAGNPAKFVGYVKR